ncbi:hypothetical protein KBD61_04610 [Patescibacteria group bacterium]|nr:hypothetical protein [Patescibacteria group bacterium]MBP9710273.1 hypothetical protein [Patescibacteria group bacterium]
MNDDFSQQLLQKIETEHIRPVPRWIVLLRQGMLFVVLGLAIICAGVLGSLLLLAAFKIDLQFLRASSFGGILRLLLEYIPVVWIVLLVLFGVLEVVLLRRGTRLYRYSFVTIVGFVFLAMSLIGLGLYASRVPERVQESFGKRLPPHMRDRFIPGQPLPHPEEGVLFGRVIKVNAESFHLMGPKREPWVVRRAANANFPFPPTNAEVLLEGKLVRPGEFEAHKLRPYRRPPPPPLR